MKKKIITISREFGSGGREVGLRLAHALQIPFYDKELIELATEKGKLSPDVVKEYEETVLGTSAIIMRPTLFSYYWQPPITDKIFTKQYNIIKELAAHGSCVIVGRCADYVLKGQALNVFICADMPSRIKRKLSMDIGVPESEMGKHISLIDKKRKKYYEYYTDQVWGMAKNYHLSVNTSLVGIQGSVETILCYSKHLSGDLNQ